MQKILGQLATEIKIRPDQVQAAVSLLDGGATVPFIARYRKEATGGLDDIQLRELEYRLGYLREMEERIAALYDKKYGIMVNSGSSALYLAADLMNYEEGAEIITPALTFSTTVAPIVKKGWIPAFVDVEEGTYNIDANKVEEMITPNTKAMIIPNLMGNLPDWKMLREIADKHNLFVLEDSADTLGAEIDGLSSGRFTDMSTTSFYGSHIINCFNI